MDTPFDAFENDNHFEQLQRQFDEERKWVIDQLCDMWELAEITGKHEQLFRIAEQVGLLDQLKQEIDKRGLNHGHTHHQQQI